MASASASRGKSSISKELLDQFCAITDASTERAERLLEACNGNLEMAIGMHMDGTDTGGGGPQAGGNVPPAPSAATSSAGAQHAAPEDDVRAPIPQKREVLVQEMHANIGNMDAFRRRRQPRSVFDGLRDFQAEARQQEMAQSSSSAPKSQKQKTLEDLFRPPIDLMFKGSFHAARETGSAQNRWLMVNIQNAKEFPCQVLNRDVWSNDMVKTIIREHFVFWQVYNDSEEGRKYMQFYKIVDWPYIAILDPRTGENLITWNNVDATILCDLMTEYLAEHNRPDGTTSPEEPPSKRARKDTLVDETEDSQLQAAIQASMKETRAAPDPIIIDSDIEYGSDAELETFSDSDDDETDNVSKNTKSKPPDESGESNQSATIKVVDSTDSDIQVVSESSSSSYVSITSEPSTSTAKNDNTQSSALSKKIFLSSAPTKTIVRNNSEESKNSVNNTTKQAATASASASSSSSSSNGTSGQQTIKDNTINGSSGHSRNSTSSNTSSSPTEKKFQFVQESSTLHTLATWRDYLGSDKDPQSVINVRFPDGKRQQFKVPCSSKLRALIMFVQEEGYHKEMYELVTHFPKRCLSYLDVEDTLKNHGLFPQETVFVQER